MDNVNIVSKVTTHLISKVLSAQVSKKFGYPVNFKINTVQAEFDDNGKMYAHADVELGMDSIDFTKLVAKLDTHV